MVEVTGPPVAEAKAGPQGWREHGGEAGWPGWGGREESRLEREGLPPLKALRSHPGESQGALAPQLHADSLTGLRAWYTVFSRTHSLPQCSSPSTEPWAS